MKMQFVTRALGMALLGVAMPIGASFGQQVDASLNNPSDALKVFLRGYLNPGGEDLIKETTQITVVSVKTEGDAGEELVVYVSGRGWCGTSGCRMLIVEPFQSTFKVLGYESGVQLPIYLLPSMKHRHPDIGVTVVGGGILEGYEAVLSFDGTNYPENSALSSARKVDGVEGRKIITTTKNSVYLYE